MKGKYMMFIVFFLVSITCLIFCDDGLNSDQYLHGFTSSNTLSNLLFSIFDKYTEPFQCLVIIMDQFYYETIRISFFKSFRLQAVIMIKIEDYEDLSTPGNETESSLHMAKLNSCQFYLILLSNWTQTAGLLKYGDNYRIINTRSNFVLNYNNQLFSEDLKYLWKRIVNVIFIREYGGINKVGSKRKTIPWFEITTVPFPSPIGNTLVPRRLDIWRDGKFRSGTDLFRGKTTNLNKQTLKVVTFEHMPSVVKIPLGNRFTTSSEKISTFYGNNSFMYTGIEIEILEILSKAMNFIPEIYEPENIDLYKWGERSFNDTYTGILEEMVTSHADVALGDIHYSLDFLALMDLSIPYNTECLTFLTPESLTNNSWRTLILPFTPPFWAAVLICLFSIGFVFFFLSRFHHKINENRISQSKKRKKKLFRNVLEISKRGAIKLDVNTKYALMKQQYFVEKEGNEPVGLYLFGDIPNSILYTYGMLLLVSLPKLPSGWSLRVLTGWYWLYCILVVVAYRASMTAILANPAPRVTIDTLKELVDSRLPTGGWGEMNRNFFETSIDPLVTYVGGQFEIIKDLEETIEMVAKGRYAFYENVYFLKQASVKYRLNFQHNFSKTENRSENKDFYHEKPTLLLDHNLHIMSDCIIHMPISLGLQKNSPIKNRVDEYVRRAIESGLVKKWLDDVMTPYLIAELNLQKNGNTKALMNLEKFFGAIVALFIGISISVFIFILEVCYFNFVIKRNPNYDKFVKTIVVK